VVLIRKGEHDFIETLTGTNNIETMVCEEKGGMKRCGGLGDILSGVLGAFGAWYNILQKKNATSDYESTTTNNLVLSCWLACCITKMATNKAFSLRKRSMTAPDVLQMICEVIDDIDSSATM
jgi:ATP-dependent NAD(P)H-hydrate dehydratase